MSAKKERNIWQTCKLCFVIMPYQDVQKHDKEQCSTAILSGHIQNNIFHSKTLEIKVITDDLKKFTSNQLNKFIFIASAAIKACGLKIGDFVEVELIVDEQPALKFVKQVWPESDIFGAKTFLNKDEIESRGIDKTKVSIVIRRLTRNIFTADEVVLQFIEITNNEAIPFNEEFLEVLKTNYMNQVIREGDRISINYFNKIFKFEISAIKSYDQTDFLERLQDLTLDFKYFFVRRVTRFLVSKTLVNSDEGPADEPVDLKSNIGGLDDVLQEITEIIDSTFDSTGKPSPKKVQSILLHGNSGCGKTLICQEIARRYDKVLRIDVNANEIYTKFFGESESNLKRLFEKAFVNFPNPTLVIVEDVQNLCPKADNSDATKRVASYFLSLLDRVAQTVEGRKIVVLATTPSADSLNPACRRSGRLDYELEIPVPNVQQRLDILKVLLQSVEYAMTKAEIESLAGITHGFVGADLACLVGKAQTLNHQKRGELVAPLNMAAMNAALITVKPSAMREVLIETPNVKWTDIGGQQDLKLKLMQSIEWPLKKPELFEKFGITPPKGLLMFGPPGCSKTMIAKALATESKLNFLSFKGSDLFSMWVGESEKAVRDLFKKAKQVAPAIVFFDEIDAIGGERATDGGKQGTSVKERVLAQILTELDGVNVLNNVIIIAATNRPDLIDKALMRPGRLDRIVYVRLPDEETRREIFTIKLMRMPVADDVSVAHLVIATIGYSGAEITAVCQEAALRALEESFDSQYITSDHFEHALAVVRPRTCKKLLNLYDEFVSQF